MDYNNLCYKCFYEKSTGEHKCSKCGFSMHDYKLPGNCLPPGTLLKQNYIVGVPLGIGGFGITYKCYDISVGGVCALKEYMPGKAAHRNTGKTSVGVIESQRDMFEHGLKRFGEEANMLKVFHHRNIINVYDLFYENGTAYYVMEYCTGVDLRNYTDNFRKKLSEKEIMNFLLQTMDALEEVHKHGVLHRDIAPDNIFISDNGCVKVLDFGSARYETEQKARNLSLIIKAGYAPPEQYGTSTKQGAYTDIYSLGATFHHVLSAKVPMPSVERRVNDKIIPISKLRTDLSPRLTGVIDKAMSLNIHDRFQSISQMRKALTGNLGGQNDQNGQQYRQEELLRQRQQQEKQREQLYRQEQFRQQEAQRKWQEQLRQQQSVKPVYRPDNDYRHQPLADKHIKTLRTEAELLDIVIFGILYACIFVALLMNGAAVNLVAAIIGVIPIRVIYNCIFELTPMRATPGKAICGIFVADKWGRPVSAGNIILRNILRIPGGIVWLLDGSKSPVQDIQTGSSVYVKPKF